MNARQYAEDAAQYPKIDADQIQRDWAKIRLNSEFQPHRPARTVYFDPEKASKLAEGFEVPRDLVVYCPAPGRSITLHAQQMGRATRPAHLRKRRPSYLWPLLACAAAFAMGVALFYAGTN